MTKIRLLADWLFDWLVLPWLPEGKRDAREKAKAARQGGGTEPPRR